MTFVILTSGIDLSVGSIVALVAVTLGTFLHKGVGILFSMFIALVVGTLCGLVNGLFVAKGRVPAFITTLGMMSAARGAALIITRGQSIHMFPNKFGSLELVTLDDSCSSNPSFDNCIHCSFYSNPNSIWSVCLCRRRQSRGSSVIGH